MILKLDNGALLRPAHWEPQTSTIRTTATSSGDSSIPHPSLIEWMVTMISRDESSTANGSGTGVVVVQCGFKQKQAVDAALLDVRAANLILVLVFTLLMGLTNYFSSRLSV